MIENNVISIQFMKKYFWETQSEYYKLCFILAMLIIPTIDSRENFETIERLYQYTTNDLAKIQKEYLSNILDNKFTNDFLNSVDYYFDRLQSLKNLLLTYECYLQMRYCR